MCLNFSWRLCSKGFPSEVIFKITCDFGNRERISTWIILQCKVFPWGRTHAMSM